MPYIQPQFDVFLAHNSLDKPQVRAIAEELERRSLKPWLDEEQIPPGRSFQDEIQQVIPLVKSAVVFIGSQGLGQWQSWELKAFITQCVENKIPVIPVLLPGVSSFPKDLIFLKEIRWIEFSTQVYDEKALDLLEWGITGRKPQKILQLNDEKPGQIPQQELLEEIDDFLDDKQQKEKISAYIAFQGGGALGMAHLGAWKALSKEFDIRGVAGTSAGSIVAAFCAAGFSPEHTIDIFHQLDWSKLVKRQNLFHLIKKQDGFSDGKNFHKWLRDKLKTYIDHEAQDISFNDLYKTTNIYLAIVACDLNKEKSIPVVFDKDKRSDYFVSSAVRASISIPGFFTPIQTDKGELLVDGGLLLNYPIEPLYEQAQKENFALIGVRFKQQQNFFENPTAWQLLWKSVQVMQQVGNQPSNKIIEYSKYLEIAIDVEGFNFLDFNLARDEKEELVKRGTQATKLALYEYSTKRRRPVHSSQPISMITHRSFETSHTKTQAHLSSDFYVKRDPEETGWYKEILHPGALLRIKAPLQMGKTLLKSKILKYAQHKDYKTVALNLRDATREDFSNLDNFLQWFCTSTTVMLGLTHPVNEHWSKSLGNSKIKCRAYFERYLLPSDSALVLALDEVDRLFPYPEIAGEFLGMLRTWHEDSKNGTVWTQLRQIVLYTEVYTQLDINQSPFNAGMEIKLTDFSQKQVEDLAQQYGLNWNTAEIKQLMSMVGGHPYLVSTALKLVAQHHMTLEQLLQSAFTEAGIYGDHLRRHRRNLQQDSQLATEFSKIIADTSIKFTSELNQDIVVKLNELGLVKLQNDLEVIPRYELYRQYFHRHLGDNTR